MKNRLFSGSAAALPTPFCSGKVDFEALARLIQIHIDGGTSALVICGTTGEPSTLSADEKDDILSFAVMQCAGRLPVIAGTGGNSTAEVIHRSQRAQQLGADALLIVTPYYNRPTQQGLIAHYGAVADEVDLPIILYNVPSRTGVNLQNDTVQHLSAHPNICGIKDASGNLSQTAQLTALTADSLDLYCGNDDQTLAMLSLGARGVISVAANVIPNLMQKLCDAWFDGNTECARALQLSILPLCRMLFCQTNPIPLKAALNILGLCSDEMRLPLTPLPPQYRTELEQTLRILLK